VALRRWCHFSGGHLISAVTQEREVGAASCISPGEDRRWAKAAMANCLPLLRRPQRLRRASEVELASRHA